MICLNGLASLEIREASGFRLNRGRVPEEICHALHQASLSRSCLASGFLSGPEDSAAVVFDLREDIRRIDPMIFGVF